MLRSPNPNIQDQAVWGLGNIAGDSTQFRDLVLGTGALEPILALAAQPNVPRSLHRNVAWSVGNLCRAKPYPRFDLLSPALPTLAKFIFSKDEELLSDTCWALSILSDDQGTENRKIQAVIQIGIARRLVELLLSVLLILSLPR